jgi:hypothetical protein
MYGGYVCRRSPWLCAGISTFSTSWSSRSR